MSDIYHGKGSARGARRVREVAFHRGARPSCGPVILAALLSAGATMAPGARMSAVPPSRLATRVSTVVTPAGASNTAGGLAVDAAGNIYSADFGGSVAYRVDPSGLVEVFASGLLTPSGNAFDSRGRYYQSNYQDPAAAAAPDNIVRVNAKGNASVFASGLQGPVGIAVDPDDVLFVAMCNVNQIWRVDTNGTSTGFAAAAGSFNCPNGLTFDDTGDLYVVSFSNGVVVRVAPDGTTEDVATVPGGGNGHVVYVAGTLFITDRLGNRVYAVALPKRPGGAAKVSVLAGSGVPGQEDGAPTTARFLAPNGIARNAAGDTIYVNEFGGTIRAIGLDLPRPGKPNKVRAGTTTADSVELTWGDRDRREERFLVQRAEGRRGKFATVATLPWNTTTTVIEGLKPGTLYQFRIVAANGTASSRPSRKLRVTTQAARSGLGRR